MAIAYNINSKSLTADIIATSNSQITINGNNSVSEIAVGEEVVVGAAISKLFCGSPSGNGAYWEISQNSVPIFVLDSSCFLDFAGNGKTFYLNSNVATLDVNLIGSAKGYIQISIEKYHA